MNLISCKPAARVAFSRTLVVLAILPVAGLSAEPSQHAAGSLARAVRDFNEKAALDPIGRNQPKLTIDEVVAAIRGWIRKRHPVSDDVYQAYQDIAETQTLPDGAKLRFTKSWVGYREFAFDVWWIDLWLPTEKNLGYNFRLRDQKLRSRKLTDEERRRLKESPFHRKEELEPAVKTEPVPQSRQLA